ncbi:MAG TPA: outer membrane lipoprotein-sorting protein [Chitinophagaceae bacterium]|nr:outer membrane lipoprotein-sorting protein [Chitinophagaceae bacterium]MCB9056626.1 outer membrane lipoprotein-sorting protein [Chitinophagales bacterium]HRX93038.1 outer membrane lipoprotein-sorting protein [Chitinophagaceae bacterium]
MKKLFFIPLVALLFSFGKTTQQPSADEIVRKANDLIMGRSSQSIATMTVIRPSWTRTVSMKTWSLGNDYYMVQITAPAQDKGQVFLKRFNEMWNWMPNISRIIRIPPSMMGQNWMGSDFTNNDLVKANSIVNDYTHRILGNETTDGYDCYKIEFSPKPNAAVVWDKIIAWIAKDKYFMLKSEFYNEDGELVNRETQSDIKHFDDRDLPSKLVMTPVKEKGKQTILEFQKLNFNISLKPTFFSQQNMKNIH